MKPSILLQRLPPPLLYVAMLLLAHFLDRRWPPGVLPAVWPAATRWIGLALILAGVVHSASAIALFVRSRTTIIPHGRSAALVTRGAYRWTRNPMYVGLTLAYLGIAALMCSSWALPLLVVPLYIIHRHVIPMEERQLAATFGRDYELYRARVRRWI
jgi:protein-S-isoprenylcysteine O-methyltransferase Ste14